MDGAAPAYRMFATAPPTDTIKGAVGALNGGMDNLPSGVAGVRTPKPVPYNNTIDPGRAGFATELTVPSSLMASTWPAPLASEVNKAGRNCVTVSVAVFEKPPLDSTCIVVDV